MLCAVLNDSAVMLTLDCGPDSLVQVQTVDRTYILVCLLHKNVQRDFLNAQLCKSVTLIRKGTLALHFALCLSFY